MNCCNGNGWRTSYSGGFAHPAPCEYCNPRGRPASADTHRNGGDAKQAPGDSLSGAVPKADAR